MNGLDLTKLNDLPQGLFIVLVTMVLISILLLVFFKWKQWIFTKEDIYNNSDSSSTSKDYLRGYFFLNINLMYLKIRKWINSYQNQV